ncbi:MAG: hypothetical protein HQL15_07160 [Candidatus Omnitrophica bacterium]|nr:hypothetical protein [Candidatus Omnitrophota bacterium]
MINNNSMVDGRILSEQSKEELIRIILEQDKLIKEQADKLKEFEQKVKDQQQRNVEKVE